MAAKFHIILCTHTHGRKKSFRYTHRHKSTACGANAISILYHLNTVAHTAHMENNAKKQRRKAENVVTMLVGPLIPSLFLSVNLSPSSCLLPLNVCISLRVNQTQLHITYMKVCKGNTQLETVLERKTKGVRIGGTQWFRIK